MDLAGYVDSQLRAGGAPIVGVSIGHPEDRSTWSIQFAEGATKDQQAAALQALEALTVDVAAMEAAALQKRLDSDKLQRAVVIWAAQQFGKTAVQARAEILAIYRAL